MMNLARGDPAAEQRRQQAVRQDPEHANALEQLVEIAAGRGSFDEARHYYPRALQSNRAHVSASAGLARLAPITTPQGAPSDPGQSSSSSAAPVADSNQHRSINDVLKDDFSPLPPQAADLITWLCMTCYGNCKAQEVSYGA